MNDADSNRIATAVLNRLSELGYAVIGHSELAELQTAASEVRRLREALGLIKRDAVSHIERSDRPDLPTIGRWADTADAALSASAEGK